MNKLRSFSENPIRYATGSTTAKEKVDYLENIKSKFTEGQLATYNNAREKYEEAVVFKQAPKLRKTGYSTTLKEGLDDHKSVKIRYKNSWRIIDPYSLNDTYVVAYCHTALDMRTFRLDRIQDIELGKDFSVDKSFQSTAHSRLSEAPSYKGYKNFRHKY